MRDHGLPMILQRGRGQLTAQSVHIVAKCHDPSIWNGFGEK